MTVGGGTTVGLLLPGFWMRVRGYVQLRGVLLCSMVLAFLVSSSPAQQTESHGFLGVTALERGEQGSVLLHLPPRGLAAARGSGAGVFAEAGEGHTLRVFEASLAAAEGWERRVYLLFDFWADRLEIYTLRVFPSGVSGAWLTEPLSGATAEPALRLDGASFLEAAATAEGLLVLGRIEAAHEEGEGGRGGWRLWRLLRVGAQQQRNEPGWELLSLPEELARADALRLVRGSPGPMLISQSGSGLERWSMIGAGDDASWTREALSGTLSHLPSRVLSIFLSGGAGAGGGDVCVASVRSDDAGGAVLEVQSLGPGLVGRIIHTRLSGRSHAAVALASDHRLVVLSVAEGGSAGVGSVGAESGGERSDRWEILELSLATGRELYRGPLRHPSLALGNELRLLSLLMMVMSAFILIYLLRPVEGEVGRPYVEPQIPAGFAYAGPGRRLGGGAIDAILIAWLVSLVFGVPLHKFLLLPMLFEDARGILAYMAFVVVGALYGTLAEWLFGRSLGKLLLGMRVVSVDPLRQEGHGERSVGIGLLRSGARNVFRWALAPWAVAGLGGLGGGDPRHRGDRLTGAAVVVSVKRKHKEGDTGGTVPGQK